MLAKVEYIKSIFKINADNPYVVTDIAEELVKIDDFDDYRKWLKVNLNHFDAQFMSSYQKFVFLTSMYIKKRLEFDNADRISKSKTDAMKLASKVKQVSCTVEENGFTCERFKTLDEEKFFTDLEVSQLDKVGGLLAAVRLQKSVSGTNALVDRLEELSYGLMVTNIIEYKPKEKTTNELDLLIKNVVKRV